MAAASTPPAQIGHGSRPRVRARVNRLWPHVTGVIALAAWVWLAWVSHSAIAPGLLWWMLGVQAVAWLALLAAFRGPFPSARAVWVWAILFRVAGFFATPVLEDDYFRYLWDGRSFAQTGNPYAAPPSAAFGDSNVPEAFQGILDQINHPQAPSVYGPLCQVGFLTSYLLAPGRLWPWKILLLAAEIVMLTALAPRLSARGFLFLAWCPLAVFVTAFNAHPDALGVAFLALALVARKPWMTALWCGLAVAAKVFALPLVPFLLRRNWRAWGVFAATVAALYAPFCLQGSSADLAGLRAMAGEWEFNSSIYAGVAHWLGSAGAHWLGSAGARWLCLGVFAIFWSGLLLRWDRLAPAGETGTPLNWPPGDLIFGGLFLLSPTVNAWYLVWLLPFVATRMSAAGVTALAVVTLSYVTSGNLGLPGAGLFEHPAWVRPVEFGCIGAALAADLWRKFRK